MRRFFSSKQQPRRGFSLVELLVVISIMGIVLGLGAVSFSGAQKRGRDARRRADVSAVQKGFEQYFVDNSNQYAATCANMATASYLPAGLPRDPINSSPYVYSSSCTTSTYCYCAQLEITGTGNSSNASCSYSSSGNYYCVSNLQ